MRKVRVRDLARSNGHHPRDDTVAQTAKARKSRLIPVKDAVAVRRSNVVDSFYLEDEYDRLAIEQRRMHAAEGERAAAKPSVTAAGAESVRTGAQELIAINAVLIVAARDYYMFVKKLLGPYTSRKARSSVGYIVRVLLLLCGDIAGLGGAAITYGEVPVLALIQATSAGVATVTAGMVGGQFRAKQLLAERQLDGDQLPEELAPYRGVLARPAGAAKFVMAPTIVALVIALAIAVGIFALRASVEGQTSGFVFGGIAVGIAGASWINSYLHGDPVADKIERARHEYQRELIHHGLLTRAWRLPGAERALEKARLTRQEYAERGEAAAAKVEALKFEALQQNPDIAGHGTAAVDIGRKPRQSQRGRKS